MKSEDTRGSRHWRLIRVTLLAALVARSAFAVVPTSVLHGRVVLWGTGEAVPGIEVTATAEDQPVTRKTLADSSGNFRFPLLPPGRYGVTAAESGYSSVTLVGVVVVPGEERRVRLEVTRTDEQESVTETVSAELQSQGIDGGWVVPALEAETLPLLRGTIGEVAALFPVVPSRAAAQENDGLVPLEAAGLSSAVMATAGAAFGQVHANRLMVVPRWGSNPVQGGVRLVRGESVSSANGAGVDAGSADDWFRGVLTLGGSRSDGELSGFLSIDHGEMESDAESGKRTAITATAALATSARQSLLFVTDGSVLEGPAGGAHSFELDRTRWSLRASHEWQISARAANTFDLLVEDRADDLVAARTGLMSLYARERAIQLDERIAWLPESRLRHELRAGVSARLGLDNRLTLAEPLSGTITLEEVRNETGVWLEDELALDRLVFRGGLRVERWDGAGGDTTEVAPRVAIAWNTNGEDPLVLRGSWGRFHETPELLDMLTGTDSAGLMPAGIEPDLKRTMRTDRAVVGVSRDLSGLAAWSLDVVSSKSLDVPFLQDGAFHFGDVDRLEVTLGGRVDLFGKADALLAWTWSDSDADLPGWELPEYRGSLALRASLPWEWAAATIVRHDSGLRVPAAGTGATEASTTLDVSLSKSFAPGDGVARVAIEVFNVTDAEPSVRSGRPTRALAVHVSYRFGD